MAMGEPSAPTATARAYDVFINHRGPDVKNTLASLISYRLNDAGLQVFLDKREFKAGQKLHPTILNAINAASVHIAIFSENYAESHWCLEELGWMLKSEARDRIIPVFYKVRPYDLRYAVEDKGRYKEQFNKHDKEGRCDSATLRRWKEDLKAISYYYGLDLQTEFEGDEGELLKRIVERVLELWRKLLPLDIGTPHPVGLPQAVARFKNTLLKSGPPSENVKEVMRVGIVGCHGCGKTTLAIELFNQLSSLSFKGRSFLCNVRDAKNKLHKLQRKLLKDLVLDDCEIENVHQGKAILKLRLRSSPFLIVLDDIDGEEQVHSLVPDVLGSGSLVILTSHERSVFESLGISLICKLEGLNPDHAQELFCWHAFRRPRPDNGFENLVQRFCDKCGGLPLFLKIIGEHLRLYGDREEVYWEEQLENIPKISDKLKHSCEQLTGDERQIFLDIACFFVGEDKNSAIRIWNASGWSGLRALRDLEFKCLVDFDDQNRIKMRGHLRDRGRNIAKEESPRRLWRGDQALIGEGEIRGIMAATSDNTSGFPRCTSCYPLPHGDVRLGDRLGYSGHSLNGLKLLAVKDNCCKFENMSEDLVWLRWYVDSPPESIPSLSLKNLRVLELIHGDFQALWHCSEDEAPSGLTELNIYWSSRLEEFPELIGSLQHLEKLIMVGLRYSQEALPNKFCELQSLKHLELRHCESLTSLPENFGDLTNLQHLDFSNCENLLELPDSFRRLKRLKYVNLYLCKSLQIQPGILQEIKTLEELNFGYCKKLQLLPTRITSQETLRKLNLVGTSLQGLPEEFGRLSNLEVLKIGSPFLCSLPPSLENLKRLTELELKNCKKLKAVPESVGQLSRLAHLTMRDSVVNELPKEVLRHLTNLEALIVWDCPITTLTLTNANLNETSSCERPPLLEILDSSFREGRMFRLKSILLWHTQLSEISIDKNVCPTLERLSLSCNTHLVKVGALPTTLRDLHIDGCSKLSKIPGIAHLTMLQNFDMSGCCELDELPSLEHLNSLVDFRANGCRKLQNIRGLEHLAKLQELDISECSDLKELPSLENLRSLKKLIMNGCRKVQSLKGLGGLHYLETVEAEGCYNLQSIEGLDSLRRKGNVHLKLPLIAAGMTATPRAAEN